MLRRDFLAYCAIAAISGGIGAFAARRSVPRKNLLVLGHDQREVLVDLAASRKTLPRIGCGYPAGWQRAALSASQQSTFDEKLLDVFNAVTPTNTFKWREIERERGKYDWRDADKVMEWARSHNLACKMHCILWGGPQGIPGWTRELTDIEMRKSILRFAEAVSARYKGFFWAWDAINEPVTHPYYRNRFPGIDKEVIALLRSVEPKAHLIVNEFNNILLRPVEPGARLTGKECDSAAVADGVKSGDCTLELALYAKSIGADGVGLQAHEIRWYTPQELKATLNAYRKAGLAVHFSEIIRPSDARPIYAGDPTLFAALAGAGALGSWTEQAQADAYTDLFSIALADPNVLSVTVWDFCDAICWAGFPCGGLLRADMTPKPAYWALKKLTKQFGAKPLSSTVS